MTTRTLESRIKFDHSLPIGESLVEFTHLGQACRAVVRISARGVVEYLVQPRACDMYTSWTRVRGDVSESGRGSVVVWAARNPEMMKMFDGVPRAQIAVA